jgi:hypothetical protein
MDMVLGHEERKTPLSEALRSGRNIGGTVDEEETFILLLILIINVYYNFVS